MENNNIKDLVNKIEPKLKKISNNYSENVQILVCVIEIFNFEMRSLALYFNEVKDSNLLEKENTYNNSFNFNGVQKLSINSIV